jgi:hypothetical protein
MIITIYNKLLFLIIVFIINGIENKPLNVSEIKKQHEHKLDYKYDDSVSIGFYSGIMIMSFGILILLYHKLTDVRKNR